MKIEKTDCSYHVTECDLKHGEKITLDEELLIPISVIDKIRAEIGNHCGLTKGKHCRYCSYCHSVMGVREILEIIDKCKGESEG